MARRYVIADTFATGAAAQDLARVTVPNNGVTRIIEIHATNEADETSEMIPFLIFRATSAGTGQAASISNLDESDSSAGASASAVVDLSGAATQGNDLYREAVNILAGFHYVPLPDSRPVFSNGASFGVRMDAAPTNTQTIALTIVIETEG